jgi:putative membrane protein
MMWHHGYGMMNGYGGSWMMEFGLLWWLLIAGVVVLIVWAVRASSRQGTGSSPHGPDALEIARRRYASGEISKEQFEQLKKDLGG